MISFHVPTHSVGEIQGLLVWAAYTTKEESDMMIIGAPYAIIKNKTKGIRTALPKSVTDTNLQNTNLQNTDKAELHHQDNHKR